MKDHGIDPKELSRQEIGKLVSLVSTKMMRKSELHSLNYEGFVQFILQVSHLLYTRPPNDLSHLPPAEHMRELLKRFRSAAKSRGESTLLYEDPDITFVTDKDVLRELNYQIIENPNYPLPEGYYKVKEKEMKLYYELPEYYEIEESEKICVELLDEYFDNFFGFHFLEPIARFETVTKVKPSFKKLARPLPSTVRQKQNPKLDGIDPLEIGGSPGRRKSRARSRRKELKPQLSTALKLLVAQAPFEERAYVQEVAETLEEILQASELGYSRLPERNSTRIGKIMNRVKQEELQRKLAEQKLKEERDKKIRKHHSQLRKEMERRRQEKMQKDEESQKLANQKRKMELEKQRKREESRKRYLENQKRMLQQRQLEIEESKVITEAEAKKRRTMSEKREKERKKFLKEQKEKLRKDFNDRVKERQELKNLESEIEYQREMKKKRIMDNMVNYLKEHKEDRKIEMKQQEEINQFYLDTQELFEKYQAEIGKVYRHFAKQNAGKIDQKLENNVNTLDMQEFVKFGNKTKIIPDL